MMPKYENFPYTVRVVCETLESNGSSSMGSVCSASMALMDAGVAFPSAVAGIAMGLIKEKDRVAILSDILGDEDHLGDMDFKVAGTSKGVTGIQMDIKIEGVDEAIMRKALLQAREGRLHILKEMSKAISEPRKELSPMAPRITTIQIPSDRIGELIGPGGKVIKDIVAKSGCKIEITDDGKVNIASTDGTSAQKAIDMIQAIFAEVEVGKTYSGTVKKIVEFGAFVSVLPGQEGLLHVSEIAHERVNNVKDYLKEGDVVDVKVIDIDPRSGKIRLSRKVLTEPEHFKKQPSPENRRPQGDRADRGGHRPSGGGGRR
jgi:polyribonucleotide nucleotidyltransferase